MMQGLNLEGVALFPLHVLASVGIVAGKYNPSPALVCHHRMYLSYCCTLSVPSGWCIPIPPLVYPFAYTLHLTISRQLRPQPTFFVYKLCHFL